MDDLLKEAIADAKAVRETALENAKLALQEAFTPKLQNMLSQKIQMEMEDEDDKMEEREDDEMEERADEDDMEERSMMKAGDEDPSDDHSEEMEEEEEEYYTKPTDANSTELGEVPHAREKGTIRPGIYYQSYMQNRYYRR